MRNAEVVRDLVHRAQAGELSDTHAHDVDIRAVKKKMKDKAFARAVNRDDIIRGAEHLEMPLDDVIAQVIAALKGDAERLGLAGPS